MNGYFSMKSFLFLTLILLLLLLIMRNQHEYLLRIFYFACFFCYLHAHEMNSILLSLGGEETEEALMIEIKFVAR